MHIGNVITTALDPDAVNKATQHDFWIDMGDFRWGNPLFDLGMFFFTCNNDNEAMTQHIFHLDSAMMRRIWNVFIRDYYDIHTDEEQREVEKTILPFAALKMIHFDTVKPMPDTVIAFVRKALGLD